MRQPGGPGAQVEGELRGGRAARSAPRWTPGSRQRLRSLVAHWLRSHRALLETRMAEGDICDGHGDLQASDIYCLDDGIRILDCLEFSDRLRWDDVCADVAFLAMDLEQSGPSRCGCRVRQSLRASLGISPSALALAFSYWTTRVCQGQGGLPSLRTGRCHFESRLLICRRLPSNTFGAPGRHSCLSGDSREQGRAHLPLDWPPRPAGFSSARTSSADIDQWARIAMRPELVPPCTRSSSKLPENGSRRGSL